MRVRSIFGLALLVAVGAAYASAPPAGMPPSGIGSPGAASDPTGPGWPAGPPREGEELERITHEVASVMRCPVCQGLSVADSPAEAALAMREEIRELLSRGYSPEQVMAYFERSYGEFVRLEPKAEGFNWAVWLAPPLLLLLGVGAVALRLRAARRSGAAAEPADLDAPEAAQPKPAEPDLDRYLDRVREEVSQ